MAEKVKFNYLGERYKQGASGVELFSFCATSADIYSWGGVPAKTERFHGGFQRALSDRHKSIKKFFDDGQASPTSVVVAFREGILRTNQLHYPDLWPGQDGLNHAPEFVHISFEFEDFSEDDDLDLLRSKVIELLEPRLTSADASSDSEEDYEQEDQDSDDYDEFEANDEEASDEEGDSDDELDVGHSKLKMFFDFISSNQEVEAWLESENNRFSDLKAKRKRNKKEEEYLQFSPEQRLKALLVSLLRPATIVDGQHRVWGSYHSDHSPILFNVCAIKDTSWIEQVFQFVVLNKLAKPISTSFLTGLLNTSLTNSEVKEIEDRLENIGIKNTDRKIIKYLNHDDRSPFLGMIAEAGEVAGVDNRGRLSDKGMIRLAKRWKQISKPKLEISMFMPAVGVSKVTDARHAWREYETWVPYFYSFWRVLKEKYGQEQIWEKSEDNALLYIVTMHAMQDMFIETLAAAGMTFGSLSEFEEKVESYFGDVPATFFQGWKATGLQSGEGPRYIKEAIEALRSGKTLSSVRKESELFKGKQPA